MPPTWTKVEINKLLAFTNAMTGLSDHALGTLLANYAIKITEARVLLMEASIRLMKEDTK
jgi:hypothetical protein